MLKTPRKRAALLVRAAGAADADPVAQRAPTASHQIEPAFGHVDDDAARTLLAAPGNLLAQQVRVDDGEIDRRDSEGAILDGPIVRAKKRAEAAGTDAAGQCERQANDNRSTADAGARGERVLGGEVRLKLGK